MRISILFQITDDNGATSAAKEVAAFEKATERAEDVGLSLAQGKALLAAVQRRVVQAQAGEWAGRHRCCGECGVPRRSNGSYWADDLPMSCKCPERRATSAQPNRSARLAAPTPTHRRCSLRASHLLIG